MTLVSRRFIIVASALLVGLLPTASLFAADNQEIRIELGDL